jgi:hypothetical protein
MEKEFVRWNVLKKRANGERPRWYRVREVWWCRFGVNVGTEIDGRHLPRERFEQVRKSLRNLF